MLSEILRSLLERNNISITKLSKYADVPQSNLSGWLEGANPNVVQLKQVADFFKVSVDYLITGEERDPLVELLNESCEIHSGSYRITIKKIKE